MSCLAFLTAEEYWAQREITFSTTAMAFVVAPSASIACRGDRVLQSGEFSQLYVRSDESSKDALTVCRKSEILSTCCESAFRPNVMTQHLWSRQWANRVNGTGLTWHQTTNQRQIEKYTLNNINITLMYYIKPLPALPCFCCQDNS